jgi:uncharacterized protein (TIGR03083 family)
MAATRPTWDMVRAERDDFAALVRELTPEQWQTPSLCEGWSIRDVVIHAGYDGSWGDVLMLARCGFSVHRMNQRVLELRRPDPDETLITSLATMTFDTPSSRLIGAGNCLRAMVIHQQDVRRPLTLRRPIEENRLRAVLDFVTTRAGSHNLGSATRAHGTRLVATDIEWSTGTGPEIHGTGEAILMAISGRRAALTDLQGDGLPLLTARL